MRNYYFEYSSILGKILFHEEPFARCEGCAIIKDGCLFVYFNEQHHYPNMAIEAIEAELEMKCVARSNYFTELFSLLAKTRKPNDKTVPIGALDASGS